jgi:hypothetical protein
MPLSVKGEWKQRKHRGEDDSGHPESAHVHEIDEVIQYRRQICSGMLRMRPRSTHQSYQFESAKI